MFSFFKKALTVRVLETPTVETLWPEGYLLANADVARYGANAIDHFRDYGLREGRRQVSKTFLQRKREISAQKFERFESVLAKNFSYIEDARHFPITFTREHFTIDDYPRDSSNGYFGPFVQAMQENPRGSFLDIGCGLRDEVYENCLYLDVYPSATTDVVVDANCLYPLQSESFDGISCCAVLEHVSKPWIVVEEIRRLLKSGGKCYIDWPFLQPVHGYPSHYYNATREGLKNMFASDFEIERIWTHDRETPDFSIAWLLGRFAASLPANLLSKFKKLTMDEIMSHPGGDLFWSEYVSALPDSVIEELACGNALVAKKR